MWCCLKEKVTSERRALEKTRFKVSKGSYNYYLCWHLCDTEGQISVASSCFYLAVCPRWDWQPLLLNSSLECSLHSSYCITITKLAWHHIIVECTCVKLCVTFWTPVFMTTLWAIVCVWGGGWVAACRHTHCTLMTFLPLFSLAYFKTSPLHRHTDSLIGLVTGIMASVTLIVFHKSDVLWRWK